MAEAKRDQNRVTGLLLEDDTTGLPVPALRDSSGRLKVIGTIADGTSIQKVSVSKNSGAIVGSQKELNFIEGTGITLTIADDPGNSEIDITIDASGAGAPTNATYVTLSTNATLTNERVLTAGSQITITDGGAGGTITVASPFYFDATVGATGADYTTVKGAIDAGKKRILAIANTTETANTAIPSTGFYLYIPMGITVAMGDYAFTSSSAYDVCIEGKGTITYAHTTGAPLIDGSSTAVVTLRGLTIINTSSVNETPIVDTSPVQRFYDLWIFAANKIHGGIYGGDNDCFYDNIIINGGGSASARVFETVTGGNISNIKFEGTFITGASTDDTSLFKTQGASISNVAFDALVNPADVIIVGGTATNFVTFPCTINYRISDAEISNFDDNGTGINNVTCTGGQNVINGVEMANGTLTIGTTDTNVISNINNLDALDITNSGASNNKFTNCRINDAVTNAGDRNMFTNCDFLGGASVSSGANDNGFVNCQFGADAGGGAFTLTVAAGSNNTRVVGCMTDAAISDSGTGTVMTANTIY